MVCCNAGIHEYPENTFLDTFDHDGELREPKYKTIHVNLVGALNTLKLSIHYMRRQKDGGSIVQTASMASYITMGIPVYSASKHGMLGSMRGLKNLLIPLNIRLNSLSPGATDTPMNHDDVKQTMNSVGMEVQSTTFPALAALYLHQQEDMHGCTICSENRKFFELEQFYQSSFIDPVQQALYGVSSSAEQEAQQEAVKNVLLKTLI